MKTIMITLTASLFLGLLAVPMVTASEQTCGRADEAGALVFEVPGQRGNYLFLDVTQPDKLGHWTELNGATGLQTIACMRFGVIRYTPDQQTGDIMG